MTEATQADIEARARKANSADLWDRLWANSSTRDWRKHALSRVYTRIERLMPEGAKVVDIGGGVGDLARRLVVAKRCTATVVDHSAAALNIAKANELAVEMVDLETEQSIASLGSAEWVVSTEVLEHLSADARDRLLSRIAASIGTTGGAFITVPNARLSPEEEHQHTIEFDAVKLADELRDHFYACRVEAHGPFLVGVCGAPAVKRFSLAVTMPIRDEAHDIEAVLASFRGVADFLCVGIDPRSADDTRSICERYCDEVFDLVDPACQDPGNPLHDPAIPPEGVHFAWVRNQCVDRCEQAGVDWIFMTEGHERLMTGEDILLNLQNVPKRDAEGPIEVILVQRQRNNERWAYPWLWRAANGFRYARAVHNELVYPTALARGLRGVITLHDRHIDRAKTRAEQRKVNNRQSLLDDWEINGNAQSRFYYAQEIRAEDPDEAMRHLEEFVDDGQGNGLTRYQARLMLAVLYSKRAEEAKVKLTELECDSLQAGITDQLIHDLWAACRRVLLGCTADDWSRTEHWIWLGDLAYNGGKLDEALQFYRYAGTVAGEPPFSIWWVNLACYSYLPAMRLAQVFVDLGRLEEALVWARRHHELLPDDAPGAVFEESLANIKLIESALQGVFPQELEDAPAVADSVQVSG